MTEETPALRDQTFNLGIFRDRNKPLGSTSRFQKFVHISKSLQVENLGDLQYLISKCFHNIAINSKGLTKHYTQMLMRTLVALMSSSRKVAMEGGNFNKEVERCT